MESHKGCSMRAPIYSYSLGVLSVLTVLRALSALRIELSSKQGSWQPMPSPA
jgi:hypothetical protein